MSPAKMSWVSGTINVLLLFFSSQASSTSFHSHLGEALSVRNSVVVLRAVVAHEMNKPRRDFTADTSKDWRSGDDVGCDLVFDEGDAVPQLQLAFLQPLQPQQIRRGRLMQRIDGSVEIAVFLLQPGEFGSEFALFFVGHENVLT